MAAIILDYKLNSTNLANPDGTLPTTATGCSLVAGPGVTILGEYTQALDFGTSGRFQVNLPIANLNAKQFCVRTVVKVNSPVVSRQNLVESNAVPFALYLDSTGGGPEFKAVVSVSPKQHGWGGTTTEFAMKLAVGNWYVIDLIYDIDTLAVAINGNVQSVHAFPYGNIVKGTSPVLYVGTWTNGTSNQFRGCMAALQIHDGIPAELEALLDERRGTPEWFISYKQEQIRPSLSLGAMTGGITYVPSIAAYQQSYAAGLIMYAESTGAAFALHGAIYQRYIAMTNRSSLGYLVSDEGNRLSSVISKGEKQAISADDLNTQSGVVACKVTKNKMMQYEIESRLGIEKDRIRITIEKLAADSTLPLQLHVKPGLGGMDVTTVGGSKPELTIQAVIDGKTTKHKYAIPYDGAIRLNPSTMLGTGEIKLGRIDNLFGPIRDGIIIKPTA